MKNVIGARRGIIQFPTRSRVDGIAQIVSQRRELVGVAGPVILSAIPTIVLTAILATVLAVILHVHLGERRLSRYCEQRQRYDRRVSEHFHDLDSLLAGDRAGSSLRNVRSSGSSSAAKLDSRRPAQGSSWLHRHYMVIACDNCRGDRPDPSTTIRPASSFVALRNLLGSQLSGIKYLEVRPVAHFSSDIAARFVSCGGLRNNSTSLLASLSIS